MKEIKVNEYWLKLYKQVETAVEDFAVLLEFYKSGDATEEEAKAAYENGLKEIEDAEFKSTLNQPEDELPAYPPDQLRSRRYRKPGLGPDAAAHVPHVR
jgi:peptide chain release factor 2